MSDGLPSEDHAVIEQVLQGDRNAYALLVDKYKNKIYSLLLGLGHPKSDAQDLTQESLIKAYQNLGQHDRSKSFSAWLYRISLNLSNDHWRRQARRKQSTLDTAHLSDPISPETLYLQKENTSELLRRIQNLPPNYRAVLVLRYLDELSYQEIGEVLDLSYTTVQNHLHRAKAKLRNEWMPAGRDYHEVLE